MVEAGTDLGDPTALCQAVWGVVCLPPLEDEAREAERKPLDPGARDDISTAPEAGTLCVVVNRKLKRLP